MKAYEPNPWLVENLTDFNFLNCPECNYKSKNDQAFLQHAMKHHPRCKGEKPSDNDIFSSLFQKMIINCNIGATEFFDSLIDFRCL